MKVSNGEEPASNKGYPIRLFLLSASAALIILMPHLPGAVAGLGETDRAVFLTDRIPYEAFDRLPSTPLRVRNGHLAVAFAPGAFALPRDRIIAWIRQSAEIVAAYYGRFPADYTRVLVIPVEGGGVRHGMAFGYRGAAIKLLLGQAATASELEQDWILVHEMVHLAFPRVADAHLWMLEGQATYVEGVARARAGQLSAARVWGEFVKGMPHGLPKAGDRGLDYTHTWGRTYWGGALFCLLAEVEIRRRTDNRFGLQEALRAIVTAGGINTEEWPLMKALKIGDAATGVPVLEELYEGMRARPVAIDLDPLWQQLGVGVKADTVMLDEHAPLAHIRRAITAPPIITDLGVTMENAVRL